jgi:membrane protein DedA with SNARE-associated domain
MNEYIEQIVRQYGYLAVVLGGIIEGESIILTGSAFAAQGLLDIRYVMLIAFLASTIADQLLFFLGKYFGHHLGRSTHFQSLRPRITAAILQYPRALIFGFRFMYGVRTITPIIIGSIDFPTLRFFRLNFLAAIVWTILSCSAGYLCGHYATLGSCASYIIIALGIAGYLVVLRLLHRAFIHP